MSYKLLIVEDETTIRRGLIYSMDWQSMNCGIVLEAADGRQAIELIEKERPDIVVMDINIPFVSGLDVLEQTHEMYQYSAIILTGYADFEYARRALAVGTVRFLLKPVNLDELAEAVENAKKSCQRALAYNQYCKEDDGLRTIDILSSVGHIVTTSKVVQQMLECVENHYREKLTVHNLAKDLHYSETFLIRKFKTEMQMGFNEYLTRYRLQKALGLLRGTDMRTEDIAEECGFMGAKYFSTVFSKHVGCSPREYARLYKK